MHSVETLSTRTVLSSVSSTGSHVSKSFPKKKFTMPSRKKSREQRLADRLLRGAYKGALSDARAIIQEGAQVSCFDESGATPLHLACKSGYIDMIQMLIEQGAPVNIIGQSNYAPIHMAAKEGHSHVIELLYNSGAVLNIETKFEKRTPLHIAAAAGWEEVVQVLLDLNVQTDKTDIYGSTMLHLAAVAGNVEIVRMLLTHSVDVSMANRDGWSALHFAAQNGHTDVVISLLEGHAQIDAQTKFGRTPLHCACTCGKLSTVEALLSRGANILIKDAHGKTVSDSCKDPKVLQIIQIFAQDQTVNVSQSMICIPWYLDENKLMSMQSVNINTERSRSIKRKVSRMSQSVPDFKSVGELDGTDGEDEEDGISQEDREFFKNKNVEPVKKVYKKVLFTLRTLFSILELRHDTMEKHVAAAIKSRSIAASTENVKEIYTELQSLKQNVEDFRVELPAKLQFLVRTLHEFVKTLEGGLANLQSEDQDSSRSSPIGPRRKHAVTVTGPPPSLNDLARELGEGPSQEEPQETHWEAENSIRNENFHRIAKRQVSSFEEDAAEVAQHIRLFHHISGVVARKKGTWKKLHSLLHSTVPEPIAQATARGIEENYKSDSDRAFESLWAWFWQRESATTDPLTVIIESLQEIGINTKHIDTIKALAAVDNDNSTIHSETSDSDTISAGASDDEYMDGVRVHEIDIEAGDDTEAVSSENSKGSKLTHLEKIKAQRRISSTPLHDYKNPSKILHPEFIRGTVSFDLSVKSDRNHNETSSYCRSISSESDGQLSPRSRGRLSDCEEVEDEVFNNSLGKIEEDVEETENESGEDGDSETEKESDIDSCSTIERDSSDRGSDTDKGSEASESRNRRKNANVFVPFFNEGISTSDAADLESDIQQSVAVGKTVVTLGSDEAMMSLKRIKDKNISESEEEGNSKDYLNFDRTKEENYPLSRSSSSCSRSSRCSSQSSLNTYLYSIDENQGTIENTEKHLENNNNPRITVQKPSILERVFRKRTSTSTPNESAPNKNLLTAPKPNSDLSSGSGSEGDLDELGDFRGRDGLSVIQCRPRTFTDTSTDDDEIRQKVRERMRKRKAGGESNA